MHRAVLALGCFLASTLGLASASLAGPDLSTPKKAASAFAQAMMDDDMKAVHDAATGSDEQFEIVKSISEMMKALKRYEDAAVKKFGDEGKVSSNENRDLAAEVENADERRIDNDSVNLISKANPNAKNPMLIKKAGDGWKVDLSTLSNDPDAKHIPDRSKAMVPALDRLIKEIEAGKYKNARDAKDALTAAMLSAMAAHGGK